jgi:hypothetical protein
MVNRKRGQASLELATALLCGFILLVACVKLSTWLIGKIVTGQEAFENSRVTAASTSIGTPVSGDSGYPKLHFFQK